MTKMETAKRQGRQSGIRDAILIPGPGCRRCGKPITVTLGTSERELRSFSPATCADCVSLFLCKVAVVFQNVRPECPFSHQHAGHEERVQRYQQRAQKNQPLFA